MPAAPLYYTHNVLHGSNHALGYGAHRLSNCTERVERWVLFFPDVIHVHRYECMRFAKSVCEFATHRKVLFANPLAANQPVTIKLSCHPDASICVEPETLRRGPRR